MSVPARAEKAAGVRPAVPDQQDAEALLNSRPDLADRLAAGELSAFAEFFELRGAEVTSIRDLDAPSTDS